MYYHIQIIANNEKIYELDIEDIEFIKNKILIPHLKGIKYKVNGFFITPAEVNRFVVTESTDKSSECVNISYSDLSISDTREIYPQDCVFDNEKFSKDITDDLFNDLHKKLASELLLQSPSVIEVDAKITHFSGELIELKSSLISLSNTTKNLLNEKATKKFRIYKYSIIGIILSYFGGIVYLIWRFGWDDMEPIVYILGLIVPVSGLIIVFIKEKIIHPIDYMINFMESKKNKLIEKVYKKHGFIESFNIKEEKKTSQQRTEINQN